LAVTAIGRRRPERGWTRAAVAPPPPL